jgi:hypothetical protein
MMRAFVFDMGQLRSTRLMHTQFDFDPSNSLEVAHALCDF